MDGGVASSPPLPYCAVIFTSLRTDADRDYGAMTKDRVALAAQQPGFWGVASARDGLGTTVSYCADLASVAAGKANTQHLVAQHAGRNQWYADFTLRMALVERDDGM